MSLKSSNKVDTNRYQLEVAVDAETFEKAVEQTYRSDNKKITIPGFRRGRAPRKFVEKYYGDNVFYEGAINSVYPKAMEDAIKESKLEVVQDKVDFDLVSAGKDGLVFKATVTTKPEVEIEGYKGLTAWKKPVEVTDKDVDDALAKVQERSARMVTVDDCEAQKGNIAVLDFDGSVDGKRFQGGKAENYSLTLGSGEFIPGFEDQVIGHKSGEEFDVNVKFPDDYQAKDLAGKDAVFHVKLHEIKNKELPAIDDEFVKDISEFNTLDEYKADIRKKITDSRKAEANDAVDNQLIDKLVALVHADIPDAMYQNRIDDDIRDFSYRLQSQGLSIASYMKYTGLDRDGLRGQFKPQAERQVKLRLALEKIADLEEIKPTDENVEDEYKKIADGYKTDVEKIKKAVDREDLEKDIGVEKAYKLVKDKAVIAEGEPPKQDGEDKKDSSAAE
ncbi:MAG TPA: trigger factor [Ruminococcaceae bacterium]|jgi:trigger factor|nr:trigger factor [Oscillospiraceae bacterium]HCM23646.1 trigger factor [Oscillospiraceae bacterium]